MTPYTFYDGPPFATGLPHYGHILVGAIKDTVTRYQTQTGHHVERKFGWDCHGLPIEYEIDQKLGIKSKDDYAKIGLKEYNNECRGIVMRYSSEWETIIKRFGRWIDFEDDYKTMDLNFMESVWSIFKKIHGNGLVYKGSKIMPFSTSCCTVLSNFEAGSNYKDIVDPSVLVTFPILGDEDTSFIAWTTTPWTLPSNLALAVHKDLDYIVLLNEETGKKYIIAKARKKDVLKQLKFKKTKVLETKKGTELEGLEYVPLFDYFSHMREDYKCFKVICEAFVTATDGTGIVHCAPGFGEEDYNSLFRREMIDPGNPPCPVDDSGRLTAPITDFEGMYFKDADKPIKKYLKEKNRLVYEGTIKHSYPFCWRSETPLMYRSVNCWFIKVTDLKDKLIANNKKAKWVPEHLQTGRFHNWLADARDWCVSRSRLWGNPLPIWSSEDGEEIVVIGSIAELKELSGVEEITDLHRDYIDHITIPSKQGKGDLKRIEEVFDCWFESGSMPFSQPHYPFSCSEEEHSKKFPGDFIAEGLDQTRGWFYTLNVIATALKDDTPYKNIIVNGLILAEDGQKMSKRKKNYPDPLYMVNQYSADAVKLYMLNSPVVRAEPVKFTELGVKSIIREVFLPWFNSYRFLIQNVQRWEEKSGENFIFDEKRRHNSTNLLDKWIISANQKLMKDFKNELDNYRLYTIVKELLTFLDDLTKWYIRLNRDRMKGDDGLEEMHQSLNTLFDVLFQTTLMMSCFTPFISEFMYQNLKNGFAKDSQFNKDSIHFLQIPDSDESLIDEKCVEAVSNMKKIVELSRIVREKKLVPLKKPVKKIRIVNSDPEFHAGIKTFEKYILSEVNAYEMEEELNEDKFCDYTVDYDLRALGQRLKKQFSKKLRAELDNLTNEQIQEYMEKKILVLSGIEILEGDLIPCRKFKKEYETHEIWCGASEKNFAILIDYTSSKEIETAYLAREFLTNIQKLRKECGVEIDDEIEIFYESSTDLLKESLEEHQTMIRDKVRKRFLNADQKPSHYPEIAKAEFKAGQESGMIYICKPGVSFDKERLATQFKDQGADFVSKVEQLFQIIGAQVIETQQKEGVFKTKLDDVEVVLKNGEDFWLDGFKSRQN